MNKSLFRIVFNKSRGLRMAVAETASGQGKGRSKSLASSAATFAFSALALATAANAQIVADPTAPGNQRPTVLAAPNGVPLINIQTPSAAGISRNVYTQFDIGRPGAILNNSRTNVQTQLGGIVQGNPWLATGSARVILNEVNSSNPSLLKGAIEVAGSKADVVIANPSGIKVDGSTFINAGNVVLTTGVPVLGAAGNLESYRVVKGTVVIEGLGLDTRTANYTDILTRAAEVNAGLWANYLRVTTGANDVPASDPANPTPTAPAADTPKPRFALDVAAIGGMYAGHIYLVGSEAGLGANNQGVIGATVGDVILLANGTVTSRKSIEAAGNVRINAAGGIANSGTVYAGGNAQLATPGSIDNTGLVTAQGINIQAASLNGGGGQLTSTGSLSIDAGSVTLDGAKTVADRITITANTLSHRGGSILQTGAQAARITTTGEFDNTGGTIATLGALTLSTGALNNSAGLIQSAGALAIDTHGQTLTNTDAAGHASGAGGIASQDTLNLAAGSLNNAGGYLGAKGALTANVTSVSNTSMGQISGQIVGETSVSIITTAFDNTGGLLQAQTDLSLAAGAGQIINSNGTVFAGNAANISAGTLSGAGKLLSKGTLDLNLTGDHSNTGEITANGDLRIAAAGALTNSGKLQSGATLGASANVIDNTAAGEITGAVTSLKAGTSLTNRGLIDGQDTQIDAPSVSNIGTGRIYGNNLSIAATTVNNDAETINGLTTAATIAARERLDIGAQTINNQERALIFSAGDAFIAGALDAARQATGSAQTVSNASATIEALGNLSISATALNNTNSHFAMAPGAAVTQDLSEVMYDPLVGHVASDKVFIYRQRYAPGVYFNATFLSTYARADGEDIYVNIGECNCHDVGSGFTADWSEYQYQRTTVTDTVIGSDPGKLLSGGNLTITGNLTNDKSQVMAGAALSVTGAPAANIDAIGHQSVTDVGQTRSHTFVKGNFHGIDKWFDWVPYTPAPVVTTAIVPVSVYLSNAAPTGSGLTLASAATAAVGANAGAAGAAAANVRAVGITEVATAAGVIRTAPVNSGIPSSSLFRFNASAAGGYLVETDPRFTNYGNWLSSDYMLSALGIDPTALQKRLGDGFYEQRLIREQVAQLTGQRFLGDYASDEQQYRALMESGSTFAKAWNLRPGIALSAAQMAQLTSDIVWLVEQEVALPDGSKTRALVPQVYAGVKEGDLDGSGTLLAGKSVNLNLSGDLTNSGTIAGRKVVEINAQNVQNMAGRINGAAVSVTARDDLNNIGGQISATDKLSAIAGRDLNVTTTTQGGANVTDKATYASQGIDRVAGLYVTGDKGLLIASAGRDANFTAAQIVNAGKEGSTTVTAGRNVKLDSIGVANSEQVTWNATNFRKDAISQDVGTQIQGAGSVTIKAGQDVNAKAAVVQAGGILDVEAGRDINLLAGQQTANKEVATQTTKKGLFSKSTTTAHDQLATTTAQGSSLSGGTVNLTAGRDIKTEGAQIVAQGALTMTAAGDIKLEAAESTRTESHSSQTVKKASGLGQLLGAVNVATGAFTVGAALLTKSQAEQAGQQTSTQSQGTTLSGGSITTRSGGDTLARGATIVADGDIDMKATGSMDIGAAQDTTRSASQSANSKSGFIGSISQPSVGSIKQSQDETITGTRQVGSTIASLGGNVTLKAGGTYTQTASKVMALGEAVGTGNVDIRGGKVFVNEAYDTQTTITNSQMSKTAIGGSVSIPLLDAAKALKDVAQAAGNTSDGRIQALGAATLALQAKGIADSASALSKAGTGDLTKAAGIKASISLGTSKSKSTSTQTSSTVVGSEVIGNNVSIQATGDGADSDVVVTGSDITARQTASLTADGKVTMQAAANTAGQHSTNQSSGASIGIGFAIGGTANGITLDLAANKSRGNADGTDLTWRNTHVSGNTVIVNSGGDTIMKGAVITANTVGGDIKGKLVVESLQDKSTYESQQKTAGLSLSLCVPPLCYGAVVAGASVSAGKTNITSTYESVTEQSGIRAGDGGFQVNVKGATVLTGGAITSTQAAIDAGKNSFKSAGGITTSDIQNKATYKADGYSVSAGFSNSGGTVTPTGSAGVGSDSGSAQSVTKAAISGVAGNKDARTGDGEVGIKPIFDAAKVQKEIDAQVKITAEFGKQASKAVGDYATTQMDKAKALMAQARAEADPVKQAALEAQAAQLKAEWGDNGTLRLAAHAVIGGLTGGLGGAVGAAAGTLSAPAIAEALAKAGVQGPLATALTGLGSTIVGAAAGGTGGAAAALNEVANNYLKHVDVQKLAGQLKACTTSKCREDAFTEAYRTSVANDIALLNCQATNNCDTLKAEFRNGYDSITKMLDAGIKPDDVGRMLNLETNAQTIIRNGLDQIQCNSPACKDKAAHLVGIGNGLAKVTPAMLVAGAGMLTYELTTAIINNGLVETSINIAKGIGDLPAHMLQGLNSADPQVRAEALIDVLTLGSGAAVVTAKLGQLGYTAVVKQVEASAAAKAEQAAIARQKIQNNFYSEGASNSVVGLQTSAGVIPANAEKTTTVIGRFVADMKSVTNEQLMVGTSADFGARPGGFNVLNISKEMEDAAGARFFEDVNKPWLEKAVARNDPIALATVPGAKKDLITPQTGVFTGIYAKEIEYLVKIDYKPFNISLEKWAEIKGWFK